jgi:hypothetical protein
METHAPILTGREDRVNWRADRVLLLVALFDFDRGGG